MKEGWSMRKLGDVCRVIAGQSPEGKYYNGDQNGLPFYQGKKDFGEKFTREPKVWTSSITKRAYESDILISVRAPVGPINFCTQEICIGRGLAAIQPGSYVDKDFLFCFLLKQALQLIGNAGAVFDSISKRQIESIAIPIPPLPEQQRIVAILDKAFAAIDQAKSNLERNIRNAKDLFQSELKAIFSQKGEGWVVRRLGEIAAVNSGGTPSRSNKGFWIGTIPWYSSGELNTLTTTQSKRCINETAINNSNAKVFPKGSLLIGMYDTAALKMSVLHTDATFNQAIAGVKPNNNLNMMFLLHIISSCKVELLKQRRGVRQKNLSLEKIKNISLTVPKISEQNEIVNKISELISRIQKLENQYQQKLASLETLKKSILEKAFKGELRTSDIEATL